MSYHRLTQDDRNTIYRMLKMEGLTLTAISQALGKDKSTISREIRRNTGGRGYRPLQAHKLAIQRQSAKGAASRIEGELRQEIDCKLKLKWSPEQISNRLKREKKTQVSHETIYKYVVKEAEDGGSLWRNLRRAHRRRKRRIPRIERRGKIKNALSISSRPEKANQRKRKGDWERDTMMGKNHKSALLVLTDRKTRFNVLKKLKNKRSDAVTKMTVRALKNLPIKTITNDRGLEFSDHLKCSEKLDVKVYFCDPYCSSQRGTNENRIGIVRQYFAKGEDLSKISKKEVKKVMMEINNRPMKCLDWKTPYEVMMGVSVALTF
jgi:IS30 family transposase